VDSSAHDLEVMKTILSKGREFWLWGVAVTLAAWVFVIVPGAGSEKSRAVLHGLCAQTPSHSFDFGGTLLPFDGRMTGIYGGCLATILSLAINRRVFFYGNPPLRVVVVLGIGGLFMAVDGFNSLLTDLQLWHPYESRNVLRLITGYLMGMALGVALTWLLGSSMWKASQPESGVRGVRDLMIPAVLLVPYVLAMLTGWPVLLHPLTWLLMAAAWLTLTVLMLVVVLLVFRYEDQISSVRQLHVPGVIASALALAVMLGLAGGRFWLERTSDCPRWCDRSFFGRGAMLNSLHKVVSRPSLTEIQPIHADHSP
jgi:uncharacterized membrane protein